MIIASMGVPFVKHLFTLFLSSGAVFCKALAGRFTVREWASGRLVGAQGTSQRRTPPNFMIFEDKGKSLPSCQIFYSHRLSGSLWVAFFKATYQLLSVLTLLARHLIMYSLNERLYEPVRSAPSMKTVAFTHTQQLCGHSNNLNVSTLKNRTFFPRLRFPLSLNPLCQIPQPSTFGNNPIFQISPQIN